MTGTATQIAQRVQAVRDRIAAAALRSGRDPGAVTLIAASKTQPPAAVRAALEAGVTFFGENRVQEAEDKIPAVGGGHWHFIGRLQRNKARRAAELFELIHSVDSPRLAEALDRIGRETGRRVPVLIEVNLGGEETKGGFPPDGLEDALREFARAEGLELRGLMTIPPPAPDPELSRGHFRRLGALLREAADRGLSGSGFRELSMGMSDDFEVAVEEGATFVRVGTALFGPRTFSG